MVITNILNRPAILILLAMDFIICKIEKPSHAHRKVTLSSKDNRHIITVFLFGDESYTIHAAYNYNIDRFYNSHTCNIQHLMNRLFSETNNGLPLRTSCYITVGNNNNNIPIDIYKLVNSGMRYLKSYNNISGDYLELNVSVEYKNKLYPIAVLKRAIISNALLTGYPDLYSLDAKRELILNDRHVNE